MLFLKMVLTVFVVLCSLVLLNLKKECKKKCKKKKEDKLNKENTTLNDEHEVGKI